MEKRQTRPIVFNVRLSREEGELLEKLATRTRLEKADALRTALREFSQSLGLIEEERDYIPVRKRLSASEESVRRFKKWMTDRGFGGEDILDSLIELFMEIKRADGREEKTG